eukprot:309950-Ditylum_brightwellii.AAC.1
MAWHLCIRTSTIETHTPCQNPQERQIGELRQQSRDKRRKKNTPFMLWDFILVFIAVNFSHTWNARTGRTGVEAVTRDTPDISKWIDLTCEIVYGTAIRALLQVETHVEIPNGGETYKDNKVNSSTM